MYFYELDTYKVGIKVNVKHADKRLFELFEFPNYNTIALCDENYYLVLSLNDQYHRHLSLFVI